MEQKNTDTKKKIDDYQEKGKRSWEKFKTEFKHDMDDWGRPLKKLVVKNTK